MPRDSVIPDEVETMREEVGLALDEARRRIREIRTKPELEVELEILSAWPGQVLGRMRASLNATKDVEHILARANVRLERLKNGERR